MDNGPKDKIANALLIKRMNINVNFDPSMDAAVGVHKEQRPISRWSQAHGQNDLLEDSPNC